MPEPSAWSLAALGAIWNSSLASRLSPLREGRLGVSGHRRIASATGRHWSIRDDRITPAAAAVKVQRFCSAQAWLERD